MHNPDIQEVSADDENDGGMADDIVSAVSYEASLPERRQFFAWHQPRKQLVRNYQWIAQIQRLLDEADPEGGTLRYLGLPGDDLLDLRLFHREVCEPRNLKLKFLGFNKAAKPANRSQTGLNVSLDEVTKLPFVDSGSDVIGDDFSRIANEKSIAWRRARDYGPYDVINLDLCDGFARHQPGVLDDTHYNAIARLLALQARKKSAWLLLLTTRAGKEHCDASVVAKLVEIYEQNLRTCEPFKETSSGSWGITDTSSLAAAIETAEGLLSIFLVGLSKWLVSLALQQQPPTSVSLRNVMCYRVVATAECEDIVSVAFKFRPTFVPVLDTYGLANHAQQKPSECDSAVLALTKVASRQNVDDMLAADEALNEQMISETAQLLELARYDADEYRKWILRL